MLLADFGFVRLVYNNLHRISKDAWRSAQPAPYQIRRHARRGIRTIINLRDEQSFGTRWLEQRACAENGIKLVEVTLKSRAAPTRQQLKTAKALLESVEYPILVHCKSGADRAGLMSVLVRHVHEGVPISEAKDQLSLRYGHFSAADTGIIDAIFDRYLDDAAMTGVDFWTWVDRVYDPDEISHSFHAQGWANKLVNGLLHRE